MASAEAPRHHSSINAPTRLSSESLASRSAPVIQRSARAAAARAARKARCEAVERGQAAAPKMRSHWSDVPGPSQTYTCVQSLQPSPFLFIAESTYHLGTGRRVVCIPTLLSNGLGLTGPGRTMWEMTSCHTPPAFMPTWQAVQHTETGLFQRDRPAERAAA